RPSPCSPAHGGRRTTGRAGRAVGLAVAVSRKKTSPAESTGRTPAQATCSAAIGKGREGALILLCPLGFRRRRQPLGRTSAREPAAPGRSASTGRRIPAPFPGTTLPPRH